MTSMYNLTVTAGTDLHRYDQKIMSGVETTKPCETIEMLIREIKEGRAKPFSISREITDYWQTKQFEASELRKERMQKIEYYRKYPLEKRPKP